MKRIARFHGLFVSILVTLVLSACAGNVTTDNQIVPSILQEDNNSTLPAPIETNPIPPTEVIVTIDVAESQATPVVTDTSGSSDPYQLPFIKPADSDTPAAGICGYKEGDIIQIQLGTGLDGLPLAGRCLQVTPSQRIELTNPTSAPFHVTFSVFDVDVPAGGAILLDKPLGNYLAYGVHSLPNGPELWLIDLVPQPVVTAPPPIRVYLNSELGYSIAYTGDWSVDETGMSSCLCKEVIFTLPNPEPYIVYLSISIDSHTVSELENSYAEFFPDAKKTSITFAGEPAFQYLLSIGRMEMMFSHNGRTFRIMTDRPNDAQVQAVLASFAFTQ